jgi:hypothetical protein
MAEPINVNICVFHLLLDKVDGWSLEDRPNQK